jgi:hypothetical protein
MRWSAIGASGHIYMRSSRTADELPSEFMSVKRNDYLHGDILLTALLQEFSKRMPNDGVQTWESQ